MKTPVPAMQEAATPIDALNQFNARSGDWLAAINSIPNVEERENVLKEYERDKSTYATAASAYSEANKGELTKLGSNPNFTSMTQVPPQYMAYLQHDPEMKNKLEGMAERNIQYGSTRPLDWNQPDTLATQIALRSQRRRAIRQRTW